MSAADYSACRYDQDRPHRVRWEDALSVSRSGGGTFRRGGRTYRTTICVDCARRVLTRDGSVDPITEAAYGGQTIDRYSVRGLLAALKRHEEMNQ